MKAYLDIVRNILANGVRKKNRTGVDAITVAGALFQHDLADGYPLLTTKTVPFRLVASELEFFIKGLTDKRWLQERNNHIWDEWCTQKKVPYGHNEETKRKMKEERDLGPIYGWQWRNFGATYTSFDQPPQGTGVDQLKRVVQKLKEDPFDRRMIVSAWNPVDLPDMALPACHYGFQVIMINDRLNLLWNQRSVDVALGLPFNIASYSLLLHLLAKESGFEEGKIIGFLADTHIYVNHLEGIKEQLSRKPLPLPKLVTKKFSSLFDWQYTDSAVEDYEHHPRIKFDIAV